MTTIERFHTVLAQGPRAGHPTPWGPAQTVTVLAPGIVGVSTASHGGIWVSAEREAQIPERLRAVARQYTPAQWYEEDLDWAIPKRRAKAAKRTQ